MNAIILAQPYVSDFLIETIKKNNFKVLDNELAREYLDEKYLISSVDNCELVYSNSENSISEVKNPSLLKMIELSKDKFAFREALKDIYPNYFYKKATLEEIKVLSADELKFPLVLKPTVGFLSFGVYPIKNKEEWQKTVLKLENDIEKFKGVFPKNVVDMSEFLIEEMIEGEEFALDAYFNSKGESVILNIFKHPFFDENDVSDRVYYTSKEILEKYLDKFKTLLDKIAKAGNYKNFPFHLELRVNNSDIIPIELNPMRFCGWCITDIAQSAWKINVYEYFLKQLQPDWDKVLAEASDDIFYFTIGDNPSKDIKEVDYEAYLKNISNPLVVRKIDFKTKPVFAIVFAKTKSLDEIKNLLKLDMNNFVTKL